MSINNNLPANIQGFSPPASSPSVRNTASNSLSGSTSGYMLTPPSTDDFSSFLSGSLSLPRQRTFSDKLKDGVASMGSYFDLRRPDGVITDAAIGGVFSLGAFLISKFRSGNGGGFFWPFSAFVFLPAISLTIRFVNGFMTGRRS